MVLRIWVGWVESRVSGVYLHFYLALFDTLGKNSIYLSHFYTYSE